MPVLSLQEGIGGSGQGAGYDATLVEEGSPDAQFYLVDPVAQATDFLMEITATPAAGSGVELAHVAAYGPQGGVVGVALKAAFVGAGQHIVGDPRGVAYAQYADVTFGKTLANPIDGGVALGADYDLGLTLKHLYHGLHKGCGLAGAGRAVDYGHVLAGYDTVDGHLLVTIEPR